MRVDTRSADRQKKWEIKPMPISKRLAAEFLGTFWLVFGGCGAAVLAAKFPSTPFVGIGVPARLFMRRRGRKAQVLRRQAERRGA
jgi:hypothetical protein